VNSHHEHSFMCQACCQHLYIVLLSKPCLQLQLLLRCYNDSFEAKGPRRNIHDNRPSRILFSSLSTTKNSLVGQSSSLSGASTSHDYAFSAHTVNCASDFTRFSPLKQR